MSTDTYLHGKCTHKIIHTNACETKKVYFDTLEAFSLCPSYSLFILFSETFFVTLKKWSKMFSKKRNNFGIFSPQAILVDSPASESLIAIEIAKNLLKYKNKINILGCCSLPPPFGNCLLKNVRLFKLK